LLKNQRFFLRALKARKKAISYNIKIRTRYCINLNSINTCFRRLRLQRRLNRFYKNFYQMDTSEKPIKKNSTILSNEDIFYILISFGLVFLYLYLSSYVGEGTFTAPLGKTFLWTLVNYLGLWVLNWLYWRITKKKPSRNKYAYVWYMSVINVVISTIVVSVLVNNVL